MPTTPRPKDGISGAGLACRRSSVGAGLMVSLSRVAVPSRDGSEPQWERRYCVYIYIERIAPDLGTYISTPFT